MYAIFKIQRRKHLKVNYSFRLVYKNQKNIKKIIKNYKKIIIN